MWYRYLRFPEGRVKAFTMSYDDGVPSDIRFADTVTKYGIKCTFNMNCEAARDKNLTAAEVEEHILSKGHEVAVHGQMHRAEGMIRPVEGIKEVLECRLELEEKFGRIIRGMAYPDVGITRFAKGTSYEMVKQYLEELEIAYARTLDGDNNSFVLPSDWHAWLPTAHHQNPKLMEYADEFLALEVNESTHRMKRHPRLFYIWGHSYEFDLRNNWELLEDICKKFSGRDDIWYATNIEIYDYVKAYESLVYSADGKIVYNPSAQKVWFDYDKKLYSVNPGETIRIE